MESSINFISTNSMSFKTVLLTIVLISLGAFVTLSVSNKLKSGLSNIPGPTLAAYTKLWRLFNVRHGSAHLTAIDLHRKYGKLVRIAPNVISVGDAAEIPSIYNVKGDYTKTGFYPIQCVNWQKKPQMNLFSTRDEAEHREQRRKVAGAYSLESLLKMEPAIDDCTRIFLSKLGEFADQGEAVNLGKWLQYYVFDVVGELTFARKLGFLAKGGDVDGMMEAIEGMLSYASQCGQVLMFTLKGINSRTKLSRNGELELDEERVTDDMLSKWAAVKASDPLKMSTRDVVVHLSTNVFAGSDTTTIALRAILYFLMRNPKTMAKVQHEIDQAYANGQLSDPISDKEARTLPYLNAVEKEAMRLHPSVGLLLERHVPPGGATICGHHIAGGTIVGVNPWVVQHDPEVFQDPETFLPERWLDATAEQLAIMEKSYLNFGAGSRACIGRYISLIEMRKIIPQLLLKFNIEMVGGQSAEWKVSNVWFTQQEM